MAAKFSKVLERNPHLNVYLQRYAQQTNQSPKFMDTLGRDLGKEATVDVIYPVGDPIFIHLHGSKDTGHKYDVVQPMMEDELGKAYERVVNNVFLKSGKEKIHSTDEEFNEVLDKLLNDIVEVTERRIPSKVVQLFKPNSKIYITPDDYSILEYYVKRNILQNGILEPILRDPYIEDIHCVGVREVNLYHKILGMVETNIKFSNLSDLDKYTKGMSDRMGRPASISRPIIDGALPDGSRINIIYADDVSVNGPTFTIRKFSAEPLSAAQLSGWNTVSAQEAAYLWLCLENGMSVFVCGETASGKTTLLNAIFPFIRYDQKIFSAEDTLEVQPPHAVWQQLSTREFGPEESKVDTFALLRAGLRSRPNYIIVGEVRGKETYTMFQAMATGHTTFSTMHADSVKGMVNRLENPPINCPRILLTALRNVIIQTHARVGMDMVRRIKQLIEIVGFEPETNELISNTVYEWDQATDKFIFKGHSFLFDKIMEMKNLTHEELLQEFERRVDIIKYMVSKDISDHQEIWDLIRAYYKDPKGAAERARKELRVSQIPVAAKLPTGGAAPA
ncbi:MAG TPA: type II/IV secretion system ATPase subunit [Thermoplasmata archaeon]|nr:type II/IV secretion system ATPase subunit [Thermoplasmata archaeon]